MVAGRSLLCRRPLPEAPYPLSPGVAPPSPGMIPCLRPLKPLLANHPHVEAKPMCGQGQWRCKSVVVWQRCTLSTPFSDNQSRLLLFAPLSATVDPVRPTANRVSGLGVCNVRASKFIPVQLWKLQSRASIPLHNCRVDPVSGSKSRRPATPAETLRVRYYNENESQCNTDGYLVSYLAACCPVET